MDVRIHARRGRAWTAFAFTGVRFTVVCSVLFVIYVLSGEPSVAGTLAVVVALVVVLTVATGIPMALWWCWRPGRVSYEVVDGELRVWRGARIVQRHPCADITYLRFTGSLEWRELLTPSWFDISSSRWPDLSIDRTSWPTPRIFLGPRSMPPILLWGRDRRALAEKELRQAVTSHGAVLRQER